MKFSYLYAKFIRKYLVGKAIKNCIIDKTAVINSGTNIVNSSMGKYSYCGYDCSINTCEIGSFCSIGGGVAIGGSEHPFNWGSTSPVFCNIQHTSVKRKFKCADVPLVKKTIIGNDVWIGDKVCIKQGVQIGDGAIIGMGAIVTKDVAPYAVVAGNPAKIIKYRFEQDVIDEMIDTQWWKLDDDKLLRVASYIQSPREFINKIKNLD